MSGFMSVSMNIHRRAATLGSLYLPRWLFFAARVSACSVPRSLSFGFLVAPNSPAPPCAEPGPVLSVGWKFSEASWGFFLCRTDALYIFTLPFYLFFSFIFLSFVRAKQ